MPRFVRFSTFALSCCVVLSSARASSSVGVGIVANHGQVDAAAVAYAPLAGMTVYFTADGLVLDARVAEPQARTPARSLETGSRPVHGHATRVAFGDGAAHTPSVELLDPSETRLHFFFGSDPGGWKTDVPVYGSIRYRDVWPGVDVIFRPEGASLAYAIEARDVATGGGSTFRYEGAPVVHTAGAHVMETAVGPVRVTELADRGQIAFGTARAAAPTLALDDPTALAWSTFLGGTSDEIGWCLALDSHDDVVVTGLTLSVAFPTTLGAYDTSYNQFGDVFVAKLSSDGTALRWSTFIGGSATNFDYGYSVALDASDRPLITGYTWSFNYPTTAGAYDRFQNGGVDVFVTKLAAAGNALEWSTFLGGVDHDIGYSAAYDSGGNVVVCGRTLSPDFPIAGAAYDPSHGFEEDAFVSKLSADGHTLLWSTYIGGDGYESADALVLDALDEPTISGHTASPDFPTTAKAQDTSWNGGLYDGFALRLAADGSGLLWSTFLGGSDAEYANGIALDADEDAIVVGETGSFDFPVSTGAYDTSFNGADDVFVTKLDGEMGTIDWCTFLGGSEPIYETAFGVAIDAEGGAVVTGTTPSPDFPTTPGAYDRSHNGGQDVFASRLSADGSTLRASTFLGGAGTDYAWFAGLTSGGQVVLTGDTGSTDFPTTSGSFDTSYNGSDQDVWVANLALETTTVGVETPPAVGSVVPLVAAPNPARSVVRWLWTAPAAGAARVEVFDARGRVVWQREIRGASGRTTEIAWNGMDRAGRATPPGGYVVRVRASNGAQWTAPFTLTR